MIETPQIVETEAQAMALIHLTIPRAEIRNVMGPGLGELRGVVASQGVAADGPWCTHHLRIDPEVFDFEICVPVTKPVAAAGRVRAGERPAARTARTVFHGDYSGLAEAWTEFDAWIRTQGHTPAPDFWECYIEPAGPRTELSRPLIG